MKAKITSWSWRWSVPWHRRHRAVGGVVGVACLPWIPQKNKHSQEAAKDVRWPSFTCGFLVLAFLSSVDFLTMRKGKSSFDTKVVCDFKPDQVRAWNMTMYRMVVSSQDAISTQDAIEEWKTCINLRELRWSYLIFKRNLQQRLHWCFWF